MERYQGKKVVIIGGTSLGFFDAAASRWTRLACSHFSRWFLKRGFPVVPKKFSDRNPRWHFQHALGDSHQQILCTRFPLAGFFLEILPTVEASAYLELGEQAVAPVFGTEGLPWRIPYQSNPVATFLQNLPSRPVVRKRRKTRGKNWGTRIRT